MADFFYWNKPNTNEGFGHLSVYLKNPANGRPGWYFANPGSYPTTRRDQHRSVYRKMPIRFGIHHLTATPNEAHKPIKMGQPGEFLVQRQSGGMQIISEREFGLIFAEKTLDLPGEKQAAASITLTAGPTGTAPTSSPPSMGGGSPGGY